MLRMLGATARGIHWVSERRSNDADAAFFAKNEGATGIDPVVVDVVAMRRLQGGLLKHLAQYKREKYALELVPGAGIPAPCDEPRSSLIGATVNYPRPRG